VHGLRGATRGRSHCHFRNRGTEYLHESVIKWMRGGAQQQCERTLGALGPVRAAAAEGRRSRDCSGPPGRSLTLSFPTVNQGCTALLYGRAVRLPSKNAGFLPGQKKWCCMCGVQHGAVSYKSRLPATAQAQKVAEGAALALAPNISASSRPLIRMFSQKVGPHPHTFGQRCEYRRPPPATRG
jgi:hypothetical protein